MDSSHDVEEPIQVLVLSAEDLLAQTDRLRQIVLLVNAAYQDHAWLFPDQDRYEDGQQLVSELEGTGRCAVILDSEPIATVCAKPCYALGQEIPNEVR